MTDSDARAAAPASGLRRNRDFQLLWRGQSAARIGAEVTQLAVPLVAVVNLKGTATQVAAVTALEFLPTLLFGLFVGVWVDRTDRRWLLVVGDLGRFVLLAVIPALAWLGALSFPALYLTVFGIGMLTLTYDIANQSMLPQVVAPEDLLEGNTRLEASRSLAAATGPLLGGALVQILLAPLAVIVNAVGYAISGVCALLVRPVPPVERPAARRFRAELAEGVRAVVREPLQLRLACTNVTSNFFAVSIRALYILYATRNLHLSPLLIGVALAAGAIGAIATAFSIKHVVSRVTPRVAIMAGLAVSAVGYLLVPIVDSASIPVSVVVLSTASFLGQGGIVLVRARAMAWRQEITPVHLLGRVGAVNRTVAFGVLPVSAMLAGVLADSGGARMTLAVAALGMLAACLWLVFPIPQAGAVPTFASNRPSGAA